MVPVLSEYMPSKKKQVIEYRCPFSNCNKASHDFTRGGLINHIIFKHKKLNWLDYFSISIGIIGLVIGIGGFISAISSTSKIVELETENTLLSEKSQKYIEWNQDIIDSIAWLVLFENLETNEWMFLKNYTRINTVFINSEGALDLTEPYMTLDSSPTFYFYVDDESKINANYPCRYSYDTQNYDQMKGVCSFVGGRYSSPEDFHVCTIWPPAEEGLNQIFISCKIDENSYLTEDYEFIVYPQNLLYDTQLAMFGRDTLVRYYKLALRGQFPFKELGWLVE